MTARTTTGMRVYLYHLPHPELCFYEFLYIGFQMRFYLKTGFSRLEKKSLSSQVYNIFLVFITVTPITIALC